MVGGPNKRTKVAGDYRQLQRDFTDAVIDNRFKDNIVVGGLMLCKAPEEMVAERNDYYKQQTAAQMQSVDNNLMRESDPRMPIFNDRKSTVTFGKG